jgi:type II secretory pathway pseudopilin PulG
VTVGFGSARRRITASHERARTHQAGETLLEVLFSVMLMAIGFSAILGGLFASARVAKFNSERTRASVALQSYAERILQPVGSNSTAYKNCAAVLGTDPTLESSFGTYGPGAQFGTVPTGWQVRVSRIAYLRDPAFVGSATKEPNFPVLNSSYNQVAAGYACANLPSMNPPPTVPPTPPSDGGLQLITIVVEKPDGGGGFLPVDSITVTKRDQTCPANAAAASADLGPC